MPSDLHCHLVLSFQRHLPKDGLVRSLKANNKYLDRISQNISIGKFHMIHMLGLSEGKLAQVPDVQGTTRNNLMRSKNQTEKCIQPKILFPEPWYNQCLRNVEGMQHTPQQYLFVQVWDLPEKS